MLSRDPDLVGIDRGDRLDLDEGAMPEGEDRDHGPRRAVVAEEAGVHLVDLGPEGYIGHVDRHRDDAIEVGAGGLEDRLHVPQGPLRLLLDPPRDELPRGRIEGQLARNVNEAGLDDRLAVVARRLRGVWGADGAHRTSSISGLDAEALARLCDDGAYPFLQ